MPKPTEDVPRARTQKALAACLAVHPSMVSKWLKDSDDFPKRTAAGWSIPEAARWYRSNADPETAVERARKLRLEADRLEIKLSQERAEVLNADEVSAAWCEAVSKLDSEVTRRGQRLAKQFLGAESAGEVLKLWNRSWREIREAVAAMA